MMRCPICSEEVRAEEQAIPWGPEFAHATCVTAYSAGQADERERCAAWVDARRDAFCAANGSIDPDTGVLEFGRGHRAQAKADYVSELEEIAACLRA